MISSLYRFHGHNSLRYVYSNGKAVRSQLFTMKFVRNERRKHPRFSIVVSKKVLKSAVGRNRIRRRLYEYLRVEVLPSLSETYDIVIICTSSDIRTLPYNQLKQQLDQLFEKAQLFSLHQ